MGASWPGMTGMPASWASLRAETLSPSASRISAGGPTKTMPASAQARAMALFSARKP